MNKFKKPMKRKRVPGFPKFQYLTSDGVKPTETLYGIKLKKKPGQVGSPTSGLMYGSTLQSWYQKQNPKPYYLDQAVKVSQKPNSDIEQCL